LKKRVDGSFFSCQSSPVATIAGGPIDESSRFLGFSGGESIGPLHFRPVSFPGFESDARGGFEPAGLGMDCGSLLPLSVRQPADGSASGHRSSVVREIGEST
jgi:hypothetical protein